jgi:hypothetical protein
MVIADVLMGFCYARNRPGQAGGGDGPGPLTGQTFGVLLVRAAALPASPSGRS